MPSFTQTPADSEDFTIIPPCLTQRIPKRPVGEHEPHVIPVLRHKYSRLHTCVKLSNTFQTSIPGKPVLYILRDTYKYIFTQERNSLFAPVFPNCQSEIKSSTYTNFVEIALCLVRQKKRQP